MYSAIHVTDTCVTYQFLMLFIRAPSKILEQPAAHFELVPIQSNERIVRHGEKIVLKPNQIVTRTDANESFQLRSEKCNFFLECLQKNPIKMRMLLIGFFEF